MRFTGDTLPERVSRGPKATGKQHCSTLHDDSRFYVWGQNILRDENDYKYDFQCSQIPGRSYSFAAARNWPRDIFTTSGLIDSQMQSELSTNIKDIPQSLLRSRAWLRQQLKETEKIAGILVSNHKETTSRFDTIDECANQDHRLRILQWLSSVPYREHHRKGFDELLDTTGLWFLKSRTYRTWMFSHEAAVMWLHGAPGTRKSKLT